MQASAMHAAALSAPPLPVAAAARRSALPRRRASAPHRPSPCRALSSVGNDADAAPPPPPRLRRREALSVAAACVAAALSPVAPALAAGKGKAKTLPDEAYSALPAFDWRGAQHEGLRIADVSVGTGKPVADGALLTVQYDCKYRGIVAVSSREGRLLGGNRTLAEPFQFKYGKLPEEFTKPRKRKTIVGVGIELRAAEAGSADAGLFVVSDTTAGGPAARAGVRPLDRVLAVDGTAVNELSLGDVARKLAGTVGTEVKLTLRQSSADGPKVIDVALAREEVPVKPKAGSSAFDGPAGGLFSGSVGPKPPPALWLAMQGMREGGRRSVRVPADVGYEDVGSNEIPPNADFTLEIELLTVKPAAAA